MNKAEWPRFTGERRDYITFRRDWRHCVGTFPENHQIREIRKVVPKIVEPEIKNCHTMCEVWEDSQ